MEKKKLKERKARAARLNYALKKLFGRGGTELSYGNAWELLVSVILSAQCTDKRVNIITEKLFKKYSE